MSFTLREKFIFSKEKKKQNSQLKKTTKVFFFLKIISPIMEYTVYHKNNS